jgi:hypothetical protein
MNDDDDGPDDTDIDDTDDIMPMVDPVAAAIALSDLADKLYKLYSLATNSKANKARLRAFAKLNRQIVDAEAKRAAIEADAAAVVAKAKNEVKAIQADAQRRLAAIATAEDELVEREGKIARLEAAWRMLGEPADVMSGFRSPEFSPLQKARLAHGRQPGKDDPLFFSEPDAAPAAAIDAMIRRDVGDERSDAQGNAFAPSTLRRDVSHKREVR